MRARRRRVENAKKEVRVANRARGTDARIKDRVNAMLSQIDILNLEPLSSRATHLSGSMGQMGSTGACHPLGCRADDSRRERYLTCLPYLTDSDSASLGTRRRSSAEWLEFWTLKHKVGFPAMLSGFLLIATVCGYVKDRFWPHDHSRQTCSAAEARFP